MSLYEKNLQFIKDNAGGIYNTIISENPIYSIKVESISDQLNYILQTDDARCFVHSIYNVEEEIKGMFSKTQEEVSTLIIFGLGCGHSVEYAKKNFKDLKHLIVIEPSLDIFSKFLHDIDMSKLINVETKITFLINKKYEDVSSYLSEVCAEDREISLVYSISYRTIFEDYYQNMSKEFIKKLRSYRYSLATSSHLAKKWLTNTMRNIRQKSIPIEEIAKNLIGKPAVIVSAGPSLNKNMHLLEKLKEKALIFAVGSAVKILDHNDIIPHFRVNIEGGDPSGKDTKKSSFEQTENKDVPLIYSRMMAPHLLENYTGKQISMVTIIDYLAHYFHKKNKSLFLPVCTGASVANVTFDLIASLKCSPIIFIGQDMCSYEDALYAEGREQIVLKDKYIDDSIIKMKDVYGNNVTTILPYLEIKTNYEQRIKNYPNLRFINASEGGLGIEGTEFKPLKEVLENDLDNVLDIDVNKIIEKVWEELDYEDYLKKVDYTISEMKKDIDEIKKVNENRIDYLKKIRKNLERGMKINRIESDLKYIKEFDEELNKNIFYQEVVSYALEATFKVLDLKYNYEGDDTKKKLKTLENYYLSIATATQEYIYLTQLLIDEYYETLE